MRNFEIIIFAAAAIFPLLLGTAQAASPETIITEFSGSNGLTPSGTLLADGHGSFYGAAARGGITGGSCLKGDINTAGGCGLIFKLSPPARGKSAWTETILYKFNEIDGAGPMGGLVADRSGALYGVTANGGGSKACPAHLANGIIAGCGVIFKLEPPAPGKLHWTEVILHRFSGTTGASPDAGLSVDPRGNLFGITANGGSTGSICPANAVEPIAGCGTAFELVKPTGNARTWTLKVLHDFGSGTDGRYPIGGITLDGAGNVYGVTKAGGKNEPACPGEMNLDIPFGCGIVYKLVAQPAGKSPWNEQILHQFSGVPDGAIPGGKLVLKGGKLYGVTGGGGAGTAIGATDTAGNGTVFELSPPVAGKSAWASSIIYRFHAKPAAYQPLGGLVPDAGGNFYGVTFYGGAMNGGTVYKLSPPSVGKSAWIEKPVYAFTMGKDGIYPNGSLILGAGGKLYGGTSFDGTFKAGAGTIFEVTR